MSFVKMHTRRLPPLLRRSLHKVHIWSLCPLFQVVVFFFVFVAVFVSVVFFFSLSSTLLSEYLSPLLGSILKRRVGWTKFKLQKQFIRVKCRGDDLVIQLEKNKIVECTWKACWHKEALDPSCFSDIRSPFPYCTQLKEKANRKCSSWLRARLSIRGYVSLYLSWWWQQG